jgi:lipoprotein-anchoring transpeptidase ErfK/SrfK
VRLMVIPFVDFGDAVSFRANEQEMHNDSARTRSTPAANTSVHWTITTSSTLRTLGQRALGGGGASWPAGPRAVPLRCRFTGQRRQFIGPPLGLLLMMLAVIIACTATACAPGAEVDFAVAQPPKVVSQPSDGATEVNPVDQARVAVTDGVFQEIRLTTPTGKEVTGQLSSDRAVWTLGEPLGYDKTYTWSGIVTGSDGAHIPVHSSFHTINPAHLTSARLNVADNATYGIAMPIALTFSFKVSDKAAVERALSVQTSVPTEGAWAWLDDTRVHWRPKTYFTANTQVHITAKLYGLSLGDGAYGQQDLTSSFSIGRPYVLKGDTQTHHLVGYANGVQVADYRASYGLDADPGRVTRSGTHVVMAKFPVFFMSNPKYDYHNVEARWAVQISNNGEFAHSAPWSVSQQGRKNVSHGCINLSPSAAKAVFDTVLPGDPVEITGSSQELGAQDGDYYDWTIPWDAWVAKSAQTH